MKSIQEYLESHDVKKLADGTQSLYSHALGHLEGYCKEYDIETAKAFGSSIDSFAFHLENKKLSGGTVQQYLTCTKIFLKWAGYPVDYTYKISNSERKTNKKKHLDRWFTERDIEVCLAHGFPKCAQTERLMYRVIVRLLHETGARVGEIAGIRMKDILMEENTIFIQGKTEARPVFFSEKTKVMLSNYLYVSLLPINKETLIFPSVNKIKTVITEMLKDLDMKNGSDGRGPHTYRHFTATYLFYVGNMRLEDIAYLLGDKVETIREKYLHPTPKMLRDRVSKAMGWDGVKK